VQCNYGLRRDLRIAGVPVGQEIPDLMPGPAAGADDAEAGSIIVVVATDAPLLPHQLKRIATRVSLGVGRMGGHGGNSSGDIFVAFSTANPHVYGDSGVARVEMLRNDLINPLFYATVQATEEAIMNALLAAETMTGIDDFRVHALPIDRVRVIMAKYGRPLK
jgi:D-aminopeptidase